jgi:nucleoside diphosphate kinase
MVNQLVSGASVAMEIAGSDADTLNKFRTLVGPADPVSASSLCRE